MKRISYLLAINLLRRSEDAHREYFFEKANCITLSFGDDIFYQIWKKADGVYVKPLTWSVDDLLLRAKFMQVVFGSPERAI